MVKRDFFFFKEQEYRDERGSDAEEVRENLLEPDMWGLGLRLTTLRSSMT